MPLSLSLTPQSGSHKSWWTSKRAIGIHPLYLTQFHNKSILWLFRCTLEVTLRTFWDFNQILFSLLCSLLTSCSSWSSWNSSRKSQDSCYLKHWEKNWRVTTIDMNATLRKKLAGPATHICQTLNFQNCRKRRKDYITWPMKNARFALFKWVSNTTKRHK